MINYVLGAETVSAPFDSTETVTMNLDGTFCDSTTNGVPVIGMAVRFGFDNTKISLASVELGDDVPSGTSLSYSSEDSTNTTTVDASISYSSKNPVPPTGNMFKVVYNELGVGSTFINMIEMTVTQPRVSQPGLVVDGYVILT